MPAILNIAAYRFVPLEDLPSLRETFRERTHGLKGTVLLTPEGINMFLAGAAAELEAFIGWLTADVRFADICALCRHRHQTQHVGRNSV